MDGEIQNPKDPNILSLPWMPTRTPSEAHTRPKVAGLPERSRGMREEPLGVMPVKGHAARVTPLT